MKRVVLTNYFWYLSVLFTAENNSHHAPFFDISIIYHVRTVLTLYIADDERAGGGGRRSAASYHGQ